MSLRGVECFFFKLGFVVASAVAVGCSGGVSLGSVPSALDSDGGGGGAGSDGNPGGAAGPYDITCTMYFQPATSKLEESFTVRSDADASKAISFPGYTIDAAFAHPASAGEGILTVSVREQKTTHRFPVATEQYPSRDFAGDSGFTGLVYVGADVQYICKAPPPRRSRLPRRRRPFMSAAPERRWSTRIPSCGRASITRSRRTTSPRRWRAPSN